VIIFSVQPEQFRNNLYKFGIRLNSGLSFLLVVFLLFQCHTKSPEKTIVARDNGIEHKQGKLYYKGNLFTGFLLQFNSGGDTALLEHYVNGWQDGKSQTWYDNGKMREIRYYAKGKKTGTHLGYWPDGSKRFIFHFENDLPEGNQLEWTDQGVLFRDFNYKNGQENGAQKMWYANGKIRMNYWIENGRRYGLQGVKNCDTVK
jgi:antitoxin component YwqK of YwqJK toxin-antitoxin module